MQRILEQFKSAPNALALREAILEELTEVVDATCAGSHGLCWDSDGRLRISSVAAIGEPSFVAGTRALSGQPYDQFLDDEADLVEVAVPFDNFIVVQREELPPLLVDGMWRPLRIQSGLSLNVDDDGRFVDNILIARLEGEPRFTEHELKRIKAWSVAAKSVMRAAATLEQTHSDEHATFLLRPSGEVWMSAGNAACWTDGQLAGEVRGLVARMAAENKTQLETLVEDRLVRLLDLRGEGERGVLVNISPVLPWKVPSVLQLPPATRKVVAMAARGATGNEIAARLDRSPETVRTHLKRAYTALGISSRTQLGIVVRSLTRAGAVDAPT